MFNSVFKKQVKALLLLSAAAVLVISCSKKSKPDGEGAEVGANGGSGNPVIDSQPLSLTPQGSDAGSIAGLYTVNFALDDSSLTADGKQKLSQNVEWMKKNSNLDMQVEGHCDERGSVEYNLALGDRRAKSVKSYLVSMGISANRIRTVSYGKEKKLDNGDSEEAHAKNRRANFVPIPK